MRRVGGGAGDLDAWLALFLGVPARKARRASATLHLRDLLGPGERKGLQPTAARSGLLGHDRPQNFAASPAWDDAPIWRVLSEKADRFLGRHDAGLVVDEAALPKQGALPVGVARRIRGQTGKRANRHALVSLVVASDDVPLPVALRSILPGH